MVISLKLPSHPHIFTCILAFAMLSCVSRRDFSCKFFKSRVNSAAPGRPRRSRMLRSSRIPSMVSLLGKEKTILNDRNANTHSHDGPSVIIFRCVRIYIRGLVGWLVGWLIGRLVGWLVGCWLLALLVCQLDFAYIA